MIDRILKAKIVIPVLPTKVNLNASIGKGFLVNTFFLFCLLPYVSPLPLGSDVQVVSGLVAFIILFAVFLRHDIVLKGSELLLLLFCIISIIYINPEVPEAYQLRKAIGPLFGFGIYLTAKKYNTHFSRSIAVFAVALYLVAGITQLLSDQLFNLTFEKIIRTAKYAREGSRGITSICPEPGDLGFVMIYTLLLVEWLHNKRGYARDWVYKGLIAGIIFLVLLSKSGTGYIFITLYGIYRGRKFLLRPSTIFSLLIVGLLLFLILQNSFRMNKGLHDIIQLVNVVWNLDPRLLLYMTSISVRLSPILVSFNNFFSHPFGLGNGTFPVYAVDVYFEAGLNHFFPQTAYLQYKLPRDLAIDSNSTLAKYIFEYGIFFLIYLLTLIVNIDKKELGVFAVFLLLISLSFSLPIVFPPLWLIIGIYTKD